MNGNAVHVAEEDIRGGNTFAQSSANESGGVKMGKHILGVAVIVFTLWALMFSRLASADTLTVIAGFQNGERKAFIAYSASEDTAVCLVDATEPEVRQCFILRPGTGKQVSTKTHLFETDIITLDERQKEVKR